jgi:solute carrier family 25 protein 33/36
MLERSADYHTAALLCGAAAGGASTVLSNPFDALRTRMSADKAATGAADRRFLTHVKLMFQDGFIRGASVGLAANLITSIPSNAIYLPTYNYAKDWLIHHYDYHPTLTPLLSAMVAVTTTNVTLSPFFVVRVAVQLDSGLTIRDAISTIYNRSGPRGFYRGLGTNISGRVVEEGLFWLIYENGKRWTAKVPQITSATELVPAKKQHWAYSVAAVLSWSTISKFIGVSIAFPYNIIMTHLRCVNKVTGVHDHTSIRGVVSHVYKHDGLPGFYKGLLPQLLRSVISKSTQVLVFELLINEYCSRNNITRPTEKTKA